MQENNPASVPVATTPQVIEQPKQSNFLTILLSILLIISISIAGFFAYQTQKLTNDLRIVNEDLRIATTTTVEPVATESSEIDPTANWKTYIDKSFSFKIPPNWSTYVGVSEGRSNQTFVAPVERIIQIKEMWERGSGFGGGPFLTMSIQMDNNAKNITVNSDEYQKVTVKDITVSGIDAKLYVTEVLQLSPVGEVGDRLYSVHVPYLDNIYTAILFDSQYKTEFDQILSTFKFLE